MRAWTAIFGTRFRYVFKVALAALLAYAVTLGQRSEFSLFSALGAAMVVGGSVAEDMTSSLHRVRGTLAGTAIGVASAYWLGTSIWSLGVVVAAMATLSVALSWGAPAMRIGLAMALVVLFSHGGEPAHYALWRAFYTLIGVGVGLAVGRYVWPIHGRDELESAIQQTLRASAATLEALAGGAAHDSMLPRRAHVLDALVAVRAARTNVSLDPRARADIDRLHVQARMAVRVAMHSVNASIKLEELEHGNAPEDSVELARRAIRSLAAFLDDFGADKDPTVELKETFEHATVSASAPDVPPQIWSVRAGLFEELRQLANALQSLRDARS